MNPPQTQLAQRLKLRGPLFVAPMAGGPTTPELVVASSQAGALGFIGGAYYDKKGLLDFAKKVRAQTEQPFGINLFIPRCLPPVSAEQIAQAQSATAAYRTELRLPTPALEPPYEEDFDAQFEAVLAIKPRVMSFIFGILGAEHLKAARQAHIMVMGTATNVDEAQQLEASGVDAIILQGIEAGGHRALFSPTQADPEIPTQELLKRCAEKIRLPLIAAGGIMNANDIRLSLRHGAQAVQMGTAFLVCREAGTSAPYRQTLLASDGRRTKTTRVFSGRLARGIENRFMREMEQRATSILPFPAQNKFTRDLRQASQQQGSPDFLSLWSGTGAGDLWTGSATDLIRQLCADLAQQG
jgi:nitronate monooxygenase